MTTWRLGYRPALTGLRGIAALLVMGYHWGIPGFAHGAVTGVTLFFTLSGFLITTLLLEERADRGQVDLIAFYKRRALRLLPALFTLVSVVVMLSVLLERELSTLAPMATIGYFANWAWWFNWWEMGPLTHTWTLSVEEQFYLAWPAALLLVFRGGRWRLGGVLLAVLLAVAEFQAGIALMAGCLLAIGIRRDRIRPFPAVVGVLALVAFGFGTALPILDMALIGFLSALLIAALIGEPGRLTRGLSWRPLVYVGTISYGLYLWHVPVHWFVTPHLEEPFMPWGAVLLTMLSFGAAMLSWHLVEQPVQEHRGKRAKASARRAELLVR